MASLVEIKNPTWQLNKSKFDEISDLPLMATYGPICMILATYLAFVLKVGPEFMKKREAYKLNNIMLFYNFFQVALSAYMTQKYLRDIISEGIVMNQCSLRDDNNVREKVIYGMWLYLVAKISELFDTVFFILRKKDNQVTFLHLYHHSVMVIGTWAVLKYWPHNLGFIGFLNSLVHVFMYTYYGLAAFGPKFSKYLTWKKHMTKFQLIQFISIIIQYVISVNVSECPPSRGIAIFIACNTMVICLLFLNFYRQNYMKKRSKIMTNGIAKTEPIAKEEKLH